MSGLTDIPEMFPEVDYTRYSNRQLAAVPLAVLAVSLAIIGGFWVVNDTPVAQGIAFTGGTEAQITGAGSAAEIRQSVEGFTVESIQPVQGDDRYVVTTQSEDTGLVRSELEAAGYEINSLGGTSASFGANQKQLALFGVLVAFAGMSVIIFALFRSFVPSIAVVISAFSDIVIPVALMNLLGIKLSLGSVAALLMLIGYSVDSDVLLNNHILRRRGDFYESAYRAMRTGVTMTLTSISAMAVMTVTATLLGIPLLPSIGLILVFGLTADLMNTYMLNLSLLRWYKYEGVKR